MDRDEAPNLMKPAMTIVELATKRLEDMMRAGVKVPWSTAGLEQPEVRELVDSRRPLPSKSGRPAAAVRSLGTSSLAEMATLPMALLPHREEEFSQKVDLDLNGLERSGRIVPTKTRSNLGEEFSHIKRHLLRNARGAEQANSRASLIMITSAFPGEGKTFSSINLAMSMAAEVDTSVLLVDADVVRPAVLAGLGISAQRGLLDVLTDPGIDLGDVILKTNVPKLSILPAGTPNNISTELLASGAMEKLLESLATRYPGRIVIFDAPPLLVTNEAKVLAARVGQVVVIVRASTTPRRAVGQVLAALEHCPVVMTVLNRAHEPEVPLGYGYYHT